MTNPLSKKRISTELAGPLLDHTLALCRAAQQAGLAVTPARTIDVCRALATVNWLVHDDYRLALRTNLVASREDEILFDRVFDCYWGVLGETPGGGLLFTRDELLRGSLDAGHANQAHRDMLTETETVGVEEVARRANLDNALGSGCTTARTSHTRTRATSGDTSIAAFCAGTARLAHRLPRDHPAQCPAWF